jgi:hypothetical protein
LLTGTSNQVISAGGHLLGGKIKSIIKRLGIYSNQPLLSNSNAMPKTKFPIHQRNARVSHRNQIESPKNSIQIKSKHRTPLFIQPIPLPLSFFLFTPAEPKETTLLGS